MSEGKDNAGKLFIPEMPVQSRTEAQEERDQFLEDLIEYMTRPIDE